MEMIFHPLTLGQVESFIETPAHALLIQGQLGAGKFWAAQYIASQLLETTPDNLLQYPYYLEISGGGSITIESIRGIKAFLQLRTTGKSTVRRVVILENAENMTTEAQNALLKILEEPPNDTVLLLTCNNPQALLPTIVSRTQFLHVKKPHKADILAAFANKDQAEVMRAYHISQGQIGLMTTLLHDEQTHPLIEYIDLAKTLLKQSPYERLLSVNELAGKDIQALCEALYSVAHAALIVAVEKQQDKLIKHWYGVCTSIYTAEKQLKRGPQTKLLLTHLLVNL